MVLTIIAPSPTAVFRSPLVLLASAGVIAAELFNTAIEGLADELHAQAHPAIRIAKDCAAAGVLVAALGALAVALALTLHLLGR